MSRQDALREALTCTTRTLETLAGETEQRHTPEILAAVKMARVALDSPEPEPVTMEELYEVYRDAYVRSQGRHDFPCTLDGLRAVHARIQKAGGKVIYAG